MNILGLGLPELIIIALIVLLFFGKNRLPELFRSIGSSINELKTGLNEGATAETKNADASAENTTNKASDPETSSR
jgi:sec-independent protein translocase protein TatA